MGGPGTTVRCNRAGPKPEKRAASGPAQVRPGRPSAVVWGTVSLSSNRLVEGDDSRFT